MANREQEIFHAALERTAELERAAFLDAACADAPDLRRRIDNLLRAAAVAGGFLTEAPLTAHESPGALIGCYRLGERIGEGGFGVVYRAEQVQPVRRTVALKIIKLGMNTRAVVARFEAERQALAMMEHPNIARVLDGGATETGRPYFVMELVRGVPITTYCNEHRLRLAERLDLFLQVCRAVLHAHQKGVIHRDLKPSNILIATEDNQPVAKVIDFGIAKATDEPLTDKTQLTRLHSFLGTPAYMSPEQVGDGGGDVDTRSDIYSMGAVLYEVLSDSPALDPRPFLAAGYAEVQRAIRRLDPPPPSQRVASLAPELKQEAGLRRRCTPARLIAELRGDLDQIVLKCLEKDRTRRYETAEDLARDITSFLQNEPVMARPATVFYRARKFVRRHRRGVFSGAAMLAAGMVLGAYHAERLAMERDRAQFEARKAAQVSALLTELLTSADPFRTSGGPGVTTQAVIEERVRSEFMGQPDVQADILNAIGRVYLRRGEYDKALSVLTESLAAGRAIGHPDVRLAQTLNDLGVLHRERGEYVRATQLLGEALALRRQLLGDEQNDVAVSLVELSRAYVFLERLDLAEPLSREALTIRRKVLGPEHREIATSLGDLALVLWQKGDLAAADSLFQQSLAMHRKTVGPDHPNVGQAMANLAELKIDQNDLTGAEALLRTAHQILQKSPLGPTHWRTARILGSLGDVYRREGRLEEASAACEQALSLARTSLGPDHPQVADLAIERARVYLDLADPTAADVLLRDSLRVQRLFFVEEGWRVATTKSLLGAALIGLGRPAEAQPLLISASHTLKKVPGPQGRETKETLDRLAALSLASMRP